MSPEKRKGHPFGDWRWVGSERAFQGMLNRISMGKLELIRREHGQRRKERMVFQTESVVCVKTEQWEKERRFGSCIWFSIA